MLDRPVWSALTSRHTALSLGGPLARRYAKDVNVFASACDDSAPALAALADLVQPGERIFVLQVPDIVVPDGLVPGKAAARGVQMVATRRIETVGSEEDLLELADADVPEMVALAKLTEPGPFLSRTHVMGRFLGIRIDGRLAAMAGERFRFPGHAEVSGVCTHPDFRQRGLARRLSAAVAAHIESRGDRPILHAWKSNRPAIALYESLGFEIRAEVDVKILERARPGD
jgi:predicted GNAT family acetyltransferase